MMRINLLPHREIKRKQRQKDFFIMLASVAGLGAAIWFGVHTILNGELENQQSRNAYLESQIVVLDKQIEEIKKLKEQTAALLQRKKVVESLQANRAETVYLLDQLVRQMPDGVYLKSVAQKGPRITVTGYAQSNARVSTFMRNLEASPHLEGPRLIEIKAVTDKNQRLSEFSLLVSLTRAAAEDPAAKKPGAKPPAKAAASGASPAVALTMAAADQPRPPEAQSRAGSPDSSKTP